MKNTIQFIAIAILVSISIFAVNAQEQTVAVNNEGTTTKVEIKSKSKKKQASTDDWSGFYVGGFGNVTIDRANANTSTITGDLLIYLYTPATVATINKLGAQNLKSTGFNGGGTIGFNYQRKYLFVGGEADFGSNRFNSSVTARGKNPNQTVEASITQSVKTDWLFTARHRGGVALKKALIYVTGGVAVTKIEYAGAFKEIPYPVSESGSFKKTKAGWTAGVGAEFKIANRWSVKGEYLFSQFGRTSITSDNYTTFAVPYTPQVFTHSTDLKIHNLRFGINYRF